MKRSMSELVLGAALVVLLEACETFPSGSGNSPHPSGSPGVAASAARTPALPSASAGASSAGLVKCETFPQQTYANQDYGFSLWCPSGFWWETFAEPAPGWLFMSRTVEDRYKDGYPGGQIEFGVRTFDSDTLRHWIDSHTGDPMSSPTDYLWNSVSNLRDIAVGGSRAIAFDYVMKGPESPENFHALALVLQSRYVLVMDWWAYANSGYAATIDKVASSVIASIVVS